MSRSHSLILAAALAAFAGAASAHTLSQALASGEISRAAARQLLAGSGLSYDQAQGMTLDAIARTKWKDE